MTGEPASRDNDENNGYEESGRRKNDLERKVRTRLRAGKQTVQESRDRVECGVHHNSREHAKASYVDGPSHHHAYADKDKAVTPQRQAFPAFDEEQRKVPAGPQEREDQRSSDGAKTYLEPRKRVASPAWFLSHWSSQQCRVVVDGGRDQNAPFESVGIREYQSTTYARTMTVLPITAATSVQGRVT